MASSQIINIQQAQLYKIIRDISLVTNNLSDNSGLFTILNILQFQIYILSIPKPKLSDELLKYLMGFLVLMNSDIEDVKNTYGTINVYKVHDLVPSLRFNSLIDTVDLRVNRLSLLEEENKDLKNRCHTLLELIEKTKLKHRKEIDEIIVKSDKIINDLHINNQVITSSLENLQKQVNANKIKYQNKNSQLQNLLTCIQQEIAVISNENLDLKKCIQDLTKENKLMKIIIICLSSFITLGLLMKIIKYSYSKRQIKKSGIRNKNKKDKKIEKQKNNFV